MDKLVISSDGYIRLTIAQMASIKLIHLDSGLYEGAPFDLGGSATQSAITGYTEWVSGDAPVLSLGWDWQMAIREQLTWLDRDSPPRSNIMLQDAEHRDLGYLVTANLLGQLVDQTAWQNQALGYIQSRYKM